MKGLIALNIESDKLEKDFEKLCKKHKLIMLPLVLGKTPFSEGDKYYGIKLFDKKKKYKVSK